MTSSETTAADSNVTLTAPNSQANGNPALAEKNAVNVEEGVVEKKDADVEVNSASSKDEDATIVHWESDDDPQDPMNWSPVMKWLTIALISLSSFNVYVM